MISKDAHPPFALMSRKPGIGVNYVATHTKYHLEGLKAFTMVNGIQGSLPRYYRDKIFKDSDGNWLIDPETLLGDYSEVKQYHDEIKRLAKLHPSPEEYYIERKRHNHDAIRHKSNSLNKF